MKKITKKQRDMLWGEDYPYSEVDLIVQSRVLGDEVSRVFLVVEVTINPLTFQICSQNIEDFKDDIMAHQLLTYATDKKDDGYSSCAFQKEFTDDTVMEEAQLALEYSEETIIRLQRYVMDFLDIK